MLITICGEDTAASRKYLQQLKEDYRKKEYAVFTVKPTELEEAYKNDLQSSTLFNTNKVFFVDNLSSSIGRKSDTFKKIIEKINADKDVTVINWEGKSAWELKSKAYGSLKEFKPASTIFELLDACYPGNLRSFITKLNTVSEYQDEIFIFTLLHRQVRSLILASENIFPPTVAPWQRGKLASLAKQWQKEKLLSFYEGLYKIDLSLKTSNNVYGVKKSLELLSCYYL